MSADREAEVLFPVRGLNVATGFGQQPQATTPTGENVRAFEALANRGRGGSRAGLTPFVADTVPAGSELIQHLNVIVDPQTPALSAGGTLPDGPTVADPLHAGMFVRAGGSGVQPNRNAHPADIEFVQKARSQPGSAQNVAFTTSFDAATGGLTHLVIAIVRTEKLGLSAVQIASVKNSNADAFTQVGGAGYYAEMSADVGGGTTAHSLSVWYRIANAGAPDQDVVVTPGSTGAVFEVVLLEYKNNGAGPLDDFAKTEQPVADSNFTVGPVDLNGTTGQMALAAFLKINTLLTTPTGYTQRDDHWNTGVYDRTGLSGSAPQTVATGSLLARPYVAIAVTWTR